MDRMGMSTSGANRDAATSLDCMQYGHSADFPFRLRNPFALCLDRQGGPEALSKELTTGAV